MCRWEVKRTFVYAVDSDVEDIDEVDADACDTPCHRIRASSDGLTLLLSWSRASSAKECDSATPSSTEPTGSDRPTPSVCSDGGGPSVSELSEAQEACVDADFLALAFDEHGCEAVEQALELAGPAKARGMAEQLHGFALRAAQSPHAQLVLQKIISNLGTEDAAFIAEELAPQARVVAQNGSGFGVVVRLIAFSPEDRRTVALTDSILAEDLPGLFCHKYGHHVAVSVLSNGLRRQVAQVVRALICDLQRFARHRFASRVLEAAMWQASEEERALLARTLMGQAGAVASLACHAFGVQIVRAMLEVPMEGARVVQYLVKAQRRVRKDRYGLELLQELGVELPAGDSVACEAARRAVVSGA